jgi:hypothetical protein
MAVVHLGLPPKLLADLAKRAEDANLPRATRELRRGMTRHGNQVQLTAAELEALLRVPVLLEQGRVLREAKLALDVALAYELERDARVKPLLAARRAQLQEMTQRAEAVK